MDEISKTTTQSRYTKVFYKSCTEEKLVVLKEKKSLLDCATVPYALSKLCVKHCVRHESASRKKKKMATGTLL